MMKSGQDQKREIMTKKKVSTKKRRTRHNGDRQPHSVQARSFALTHGLFTERVLYALSDLLVGADDVAKKDLFLSRRLEKIKQRVEVLLPH